MVIDLTKQKRLQNQLLPIQQSKLKQNAICPKNFTLKLNRKTRIFLCTLWPLKTSQKSTRNFWLTRAIFICEANNQHMLVKVHCRQVHLIVAHFYPPPLSTKKKYHDLHVSARIHPKNSLKFCLVIQKCWQAVHLCDFFFCGFYNQFQQRQRSGRNKICRKYCCRVFKRQIRDCSLFHYRPGACHTCFYF